MGSGVTYAVEAPENDSRKAVVLSAAKDLFHRFFAFAQNDNNILQSVSGPKGLLPWADLVW